MLNSVITCPHCGYASAEVMAINACQFWGAKAISQEICKPERATFHLLERGLLPARKIGGVWAASRRKLRVAIIGDE
jgi:hypothetical protein